MVQARHVVEGPLDPGLELVDPRGPGLGVGRHAVAARVEPGLEQLHQQPGDVDVVAQRVLDVVEGEGRVALLHVLRVGAEHGRLAPGDARPEDQRVEAVDLVVAVPHRAQRVLEQLAGVGGQRPGVAQPELVDVRRPAQALEPVRPLVDDLDAHRGEHRQDLRQRQGRSDAEHLEPGLPAAGVHLLVEGEVDAVLLLVRGHRLQPAEVDRGGPGREVLLVRLGEGVDVAAGEPGADLLAVLRDHGALEVVAPRARRVGEAALEVDGVDVDDVAAVRRVHDEVDAGGRGLVDADVELDRLAAQPLLEDLGEPLTDGRVVAVAGQVDEDGDVAAVGVAADEHPDLAPLAGVHGGLGHRGELVDGGVEQLVARVGLERVHQRLAGVAAGVEAAVLEDRRRLLPQQRDPGQRLGVGGAGEQAEEATLPDDLAVLELLDPDVVEVRRPVHGGARVRLRQHEQGLLAGLGLHHRGQLAERRRHVLVGPEDAEAGAGQRTQQLVLAVPLEPVLAVPEEREVVVGQPLEQLATLADLVGIQRRRFLLELVDDGEHLGVHLLPVLDRLPDVAQHPLHGLLDLRGVVVAVAHPVDLDVHPGLADRPVGGLERAVLDRHHALEGAGDVADDVEVRVDDDVHAAELARELHRERVDEERHVVGDHLDHRVAARRPAVLAQARGERVDPRGPLGPVAGELVVRREGAVHVDLGAVDDVLGGDVAVVRVEERAHRLVRRSARPLARHGQVGGLAQQLGLVHIQRRR